MPAPVVAATAEDAAVTAKLRSFVAQLQRGTVDRATLTAEIYTALTPQAVSQLAAEFGSLGELRALTFRAKEPAEGLISYHYRGAFAGGQTIPLTIALDKNAKIAGFFIG